MKEYWKHLCQMDDGLWYFWARWDREWIGGYNDPEEAEEWCREYHDEYQRELFEELSDELDSPYDSEAPEGIFGKVKDIFG